MAGLVLELCGCGRRMLYSVMGILAAIIVLSQLFTLPSERYISTLLPGDEDSPLITIQNHLRVGNVVTCSTVDIVEEVGNTSIKTGKHGKCTDLTSHLPHERSKHDAFGKNLTLMGNLNLEMIVTKLNISSNSNIRDSVEDSHNKKISTTGQVSIGRMGSLGTRSVILASTSSSKAHRIKQVMELEVGYKNDSLMIERFVRKMRGATISLSHMKSMLLNGPASSTSVRRKWSSARDRELLSASFQIRNAPVLRSFLDLHAPLFRNVSVFKRSYDLMERLLKIYVYKEGEKPIFHQPRLRGLYAAEGWFMKLIKRSKNFTVTDPKRAHLFYLPFSTGTLRMTLNDEKGSSVKDLEHYLTNYVDLIKKRHRFWNRTAGADHFFVACHDWGERITRHHMSSCIRGLCNANVARGFSVGKDVSVPVTYVRSGKDPTRDIGGKPPSERYILGFFAGQMHGYLRPLLLQYWENKVPEMKILGPMQPDVQGKAVYREYMKSSKYCICARGYEVHTPRIVESIFYECIPVIIADNYLPPFFEVLDWEAFAVFVQEKDIPNLRNILLSIPEERYLDMQQKLRMVRQHFIWHETPEKYDLFHMILHSVWYNRVSQLRPA